MSRTTSFALISRRTAREVRPPLGSRGLVARMARELPTPRGLYLRRRCGQFVCERMLMGNVWQEQIDGWQMRVTGGLRRTLFKISFPSCQNSGKRTRMI